MAEKKAKVEGNVYVTAEFRDKDDFAKVYHKDEDVTTTFDEARRDELIRADMIAIHAEPGPSAEEKAKAEKAEADKAKADKAKSDKAEADKAKAEKAEADKAKAEKAEADKAKAEKAEADKAKAEADKAKADAEKAANQPG